MFGRIHRLNLRIDQMKQVIFAASIADSPGEQASVAPAPRVL
jgi:hypothetical protein